MFVRLWLYLKSFKLIAIGLRRQKQLNANPKAIQQIDFVGQVKNVDGMNADGAESIFILTILERIKETRLKFSQESVTVLM